MYVPAGRTVQLQLFVSPKDVIHAFYVPQFLFKRDVVPGRTTAFDFTVNESDAGQTFRGQCAELCGTAPQHDAVRREGRDRARVRHLARRQGRRGQRDAAAGRRAAAPGGPGDTLKITAQNITFVETDLPVKAGAPFRIEFDNQDAGVPHNVAIHLGSPTGTEVFKGAIFPGVATQTYDVQALDAGAYAFVCTVHPTMTGTLTVQ